MPIATLHRANGPIQQGQEMDRLTRESLAVRSRHSTAAHPPRLGGQFLRTDMGEAGFYLL